MNDLFSFANIYRCYLKCRKRKRKTINALRFEMRLEDNLCKLEKELKTKTYKPARSVCFVAKKPKFREIFAADFKDRIVHHILVDYLEKIYEPVFIYDSWASRKGKGTIGAVKRLQKFTRSITSNGVATAFYLQLDIKSFFVNINKDILKTIIRKKTDNKNILWLLDVILDNNCAQNYVLKGDPSLIKKIPPHKTLFNSPVNKGLPIGNLTSQFFANVYLNELDQFVKHKLKVRFYIRYVDDFVLLSKNKEDLILWAKKIESFLKENLDLELNWRKSKLRPISDGIDFLGYIIRPNYVLVRRRVVNNCKSRLRDIQKRLSHLNNDDRTLEFVPSIVEKTRKSFSSYLSHFKHANSYNLINLIFDKFPFLNDYYKYFNLVLPHNFSSLKKQYEFFKNKLPSDDIIFFQVGCFYKFFNEEAIKVAKILGLNIIKKEEEIFAGFPVRFEMKYIDIAIRNKCNVYIINEGTYLVRSLKMVPASGQDDRLILSLTGFTHKLRPRLLTRKYSIHQFKQYIKSLTIIFLLFYLSSCSVYEDKVMIRGDSLYPMFKNEDQAKIIRKCDKGFKVSYGSVVVFNYPGRKVPVVKIVKAVGGDVFGIKEIEEGKCELFINNEILKDLSQKPYIFSSQQCKMIKLYENDFKGVVPSGFYLVFGAQSCANCLDSGKFGFLSDDKIIGVLR